MEFRQMYLTFTKGTVTKMLDRRPLKYPIIRDLSCISPSVMLSPDTALKRLNLCIDKLMSLNRIDGLDEDIIEDDYERIIANEKVKEKLKNYEECNDRLDEFFQSLFKIIKVTIQLRNFVLLILTLHHGN